MSEPAIRDRICRRWASRPHRPDRALLAVKVHLGVRPTAAFGPAPEVSTRTLPLIALLLCFFIRLEPLQASINVPSTMKCSELMSWAVRVCATISWKNSCATSCFKSRSRFFENVLWSNGASVMSCPGTSGTACCSRAARRTSARCDRVQPHQKRALQQPFWGRGCPPRTRVHGVEFAGDLLREKLSKSHVRAGVPPAVTGGQPSTAIVRLALAALTLAAFTSIPRIAKCEFLPRIQCTIMLVSRTS